MFKFNKYTRNKYNKLSSNAGNELPFLRKEREEGSS